MKLKLHLLLAALFLMGNSSYAQRVGSYKIKNTQVVSQKHAKPNYQKPKFYIMPEVGVGYSWVNASDLPTDRQNLNKITAELGLEINKFFSFGFGVGYSYSTRNYNPMSAPIISSMPLYFNMHGNFSKKKVSPYWSLDFGYAVPIESFRYHIISCDDPFYHEISESSFDCYEEGRAREEGLCISSEFGLRFGKCCYLGVQGSLFQFRNNGYSCTWHYDPDWDYYSTDYYYFNLSLKLGFKIMKK